MRRAVLLVGLVGISCLWAFSSTAKLLGGGTPIDRGGNTSTFFCPCDTTAYRPFQESPELPQYISFTSEGSAVMLRIRAQTHSTLGGLCCACPPTFEDTVCVDNSYCTRELVYLRPRLDNITILRKDTFLANLTSLEGACLYPDPKAVFNFTNLEPSAFVFREFFDTEPNSGWDLTDGASFVSGFSAVRNAEDLQFPYSGPGGSLGFGMEANPPVLPECCPYPDSIIQIASTNIVIGGLQPGEDYALSYWWSAMFD